MALGAPGGVKVPAGTSTADLTVVFGMSSLVRWEHVGAADITDGTTEQAAQRNNRVRKVMTCARLSAAARAPPGRIAGPSFRHPASAARWAAKFLPRTRG